MHSSELLKGTLQTIILKVLADNNDKMYGYEIAQKVKELSIGTIQLTEGALYPALHKLEAEGLVKTETVMSGKRVRKYYTLTRSGRNTVLEKIREFTAFVRTMSTVLKLQIA